MSDLREQLQAIYATRGRLTPDDVVEVARDPEHPLHNRFEWNDSVAGEQWRRAQAQEMIRSVKVVYVDREGQQLKTRAFVAIRNPVMPDTEDDDTVDDEPEVNGGYRYLPVETVARDEVLAKQALAEMERDWRTLRNRYDQFAEFWELVRREAGEGTDA